MHFWHKHTCVGGCTLLVNSFNVLEGPADSFHSIQIQSVGLKNCPLVQKLSFKFQGAETPLGKGTKTLTGKLTHFKVNVFCSF